MRSESATRFIPRLLYAFNAETGENSGPSSCKLYPNIATPMTYELDGRQYVSVLSGNGSTASAPGRLYTFTLDGTASMPIIRR